MKKIFLLLLLFTSTLFSQTILTITHPVQEYFIKKIAYDKFYIKTVFSEKKEFDLLTKRDLNSLSFSKYYLTLGLPEEEEIIKVLKSRNQELKIINTIKGLSTLNDKNGLSNPYIWMDPIICREYAKKLYTELVKIQGYNKDFFKENLENFLNELDEIYLYLKEKIDRSEVYGFIAFNPKLDYFAKRFRLNVYQKENRIIHLNEVLDFVKLSQKEHLKHIVLDKDNNYKIAQSYANYIDGKIIEVDIFERNWKIEIYALARRLSTL